MKSEHADNPLISVVMPVYNAGDYLSEAIESILEQTYPHFEFIIVDDCSTDGSTKVIKAFAALDSRIRPIYISHSGAGGAANAGIAAAKGEFIARMDADDIALPERFATQLSWMLRTGVDICGSCVKVFGAENRLLWFPETHEAIRKELLFRSTLLQGTVMMRATIAKNNPYNERLSFEDYELWTRLLPCYRASNIQQVLLKYRFHSQQRHVQKATAIRNEVREYGHSYFRTLFPEATKEDETVIGHIRDSTPVTSVVELELAGAWLVRIAQGEDSFLRFRMAQRWWSICCKSSSLGMRCYQRYQQKMPEFGLKSRKKLVILWTLCLLRLKSGSRFESKLKWLYRRIAKVYEI